MFFNDETKIKISCVISYKLLYPQFGECMGRVSVPWPSGRVLGTLWVC